MKAIFTFLTLLVVLSLDAATFNVSSTSELRKALIKAARNGEDNTIILADGIYKTTDDGKGTFIYNSNNSYQLTLKGSSSNNVILSGDKQHKIFKFKSNHSGTLKLEKLTFMDGNSSYYYGYDNHGGGIYADYNIEIIDCNFTNN